VPRRNITEFRNFSDKCACQLQNHDLHSLTCKKPPMGKTQCRLACPRCLSNGTGLVQLIRPLVANRFDAIEEYANIRPPAPETLILEHAANGINPFPAKDDRLISLHIRRDGFSMEQVAELDLLRGSDPKRLAPSNGNITEFNVTLTGCVKCNTCNSPIGNENEATIGISVNFNLF
jgi:hypothetical protein